MAEAKKASSSSTRAAWRWIPTLYFAEGLPYTIVILVSVVMYKRLDISNTEIALYTSWLYLPWVIKPIWSPIVDTISTKRFWIVSTQLLIGAGLAGVAFTIPTSNFFQYSLAFMWLLAFSSATHDISADGFYMLGLNDHDQAWFVGIRSTFYRLSMIAGQGLLVILAGTFETKFDSVKTGWSVTFLVAAGVYLLAWLYHTRALPRPDADDRRVVQSAGQLLAGIRDAFATFVQKKNVVTALSFFLLYRLGEAQLVKMASPFLLDSAAAGGLALSTTQVGFVYGTVGVLALTAGGILGGLLAAKNGLKYWLGWMVVAINIPNAVYVFLAFTTPDNFLIVNAAVAVEQFGYGFGFTAYMLYMIYFADGPHKTSHFAICTGFMAFGMMLPGMVSGFIQESIGYQLFFIWVLIATIPGFIVTYLIPVDPEFGKNEKSEQGSAEPE